MFSLFLSIQIIPHPDFKTLIKLCEVSFEVAHWWLPGIHDTDLMIGVAKYVVSYIQMLNSNLMRFMACTASIEKKLFITYFSYPNQIHFHRVQKCVVLLSVP